MLKNPNIRTKSEFLAALTDCVLSRGVAGGGLRGLETPLLSSAIVGGAIQHSIILCMH